jgi:uncharacterized protein YbdZ (MbtH family)
VAKFSKAAPIKGVASPAKRSGSFMSTRHTAAAMEKCSIFDATCQRPGGRTTVYCSDNTLATIAWATCTMDFRPETLMAKGLELLIGVGFPAGALVSRAILRALEAKAAAAAVEKAAAAASRPMKGGLPPSPVPGGWQVVTESMSARSAAYQSQITGVASGQSYLVKGVKFDGYAGGVLQEAKGPGYAQFVRDGQFTPWFAGADSLASQASRQLAAAGGTPVSWYVAESSAAAAIKQLFAQRGITGISIVTVPAK